MAAAHGHATPSLIAELFARPEAFDFFQAVRVLERVAALAGDREPVGGDRSPERESVRFRVRPSLAFATAEVVEAKRGEAGAPPELAVSFFGFVGPAGVLPQHYTELAIERQQLRDTTLRDFLDLFQHRALALFYRAWARARLAVAHEHHRATRRGEDPFTRALLGLVGCGLGALRSRRALDDSFLLYASGHMSSRRRTAQGLRQIVADLSRVPVEVEELVGSWLEIPTEERCALGAHDARASLGAGATLGHRAWDVQREVRLVLGPLTLRDFERLCPGGSGHAELASVIEAYLDLEWSCALRFVLAPGQSPGIRLQRGGARLGVDSWLETRVFPEALRRADFGRGQAYGVQP
jgi:type VI secretion system protein ImpH